MGKEMTFTDDNFKQEVLESDIPVLVDYWATWCGPCRMMTPVIEALAEEYAGKAKIGKVNTEECPQTTAEFGIVSIPTIILYKDGKPVDQIIGAVSQEVIAEKLDAIF